MSGDDFHEHHTFLLKDLPLSSSSFILRHIRNRKVCHRRWKDGNIASTISPLVESLVASFNCCSHMMSDSCSMSLLTYKAQAKLEIESFGFFIPKNRSSRAALFSEPPSAPTARQKSQL
jgi:hypothetical protein